MFKEILMYLDFSCLYFDWNGSTWINTVYVHYSHVPSVFCLSVRLYLVIPKKMDFNTTQCG